MDRTNEIGMIEVAKIHPHPDNPRKDLGDLSELAESIRHNGVMQNLTVVEGGSVAGYDGKERHYVCVIGHRRLAAAKIAGLDKVPCIVAEMSGGEQIATMLYENIQRADLTPFEQARGMQMMMELGETVRSICDKTGFAETTVRHRLEIAKLPPGTAEEKAAQGATLMDFIELEKVEDIQERAKLLELMGTNEYDWRLSNAITGQIKAKNRQKVTAVLDTFAHPLGENIRYGDLLAAYEPVENAEMGGSYMFLDRDGFDADAIKPDDAGERKYVYEINNSWLRLFVEREDADGTEGAEPDEEAEQREVERREQEERQAALFEAFNTAYSLRMGFAKDIAAASLNEKKLMRHAAMIITGLYGAPAEDDAGAEEWFADFSRYNDFGMEDTLNNKALKAVTEYARPDEEFAEFVNAHLTLPGPFDKKWLFHVLYSAVDSNARPYNGRSEYDSDGLAAKELARTYRFLSEYGYKMSTDEQKLLDGTHELYARKESEEEE
jgi:ParB family chromosome partitioning protein